MTEKHNMIALKIQNGGRKNYNEEQRGRGVKRKLKRGIEEG